MYTGYIYEARDVLYDTCSSRRDLTKGVDVCHDIVPPLLFFYSGDLKLFFVQMLHRKYIIIYSQ